MGIIIRYSLAYSFAVKTNYSGAETAESRDEKTEKDIIKFFSTLNHTVKKTRIICSLYL